MLPLVVNPLFITSGSRDPLTRSRSDPTIITMVLTDIVMT